MNWKSIFKLLLLVTFFTSTASAQVPGQPANSFVQGSNWYCNSGYQKSGNECVSIFAGMGGKPANSFVQGSNWYCNSGYQKSGNECVSIFGASANAPANAPANASANTAAALPTTTYPSPTAPLCAENGSCYGDISPLTGNPKTVPVQGYFRSNGTYVRGHYRSK